jgi:hypothetical protein
MKMAVSPERARELIGNIEHKSCQAGVVTRWRTTPDAQATAASFLWLFCWAKTGMNSERARQAAVEAFDEIFELGFVEVDRRIPHDWAREKRYVVDLPDGELTRRLQP